MADNKQYITQEQDNGAVMISEDVICTIISHAVKEVEGVESLASKAGLDIADLLGKKNIAKGMKVVIAEDDTLFIDCNIVIYYGHSVVTVAKAVQDSVRNALESMTGVKVGAVNINICGIVRQ